MEQQGFEYSVQWQGNNQFYGHTYAIAERMFKSRIECMINVSRDIDVAISHLQVWFECLKELYNIISYYLDDAEYKELSEYINKIDVLTDKKDFYHVQLNNGTANNIKDILEIFTHKVWVFQGKYGFLPKRTQKRTFDDLDEQIEYENT